jgi:hypothetical protein
MHLNKNSPGAWQAHLTDATQTAVHRSADVLLTPRRTICSHPFPHLSSALCPLSCAPCPVPFALCPLPSSSLVVLESFQTGVKIRPSKRVFLRQRCDRIRNVVRRLWHYENLPRSNGNLRRDGHVAPARHWVVARVVRGAHLQRSEGHLRIGFALEICPRSARESRNLPARSVSS